jgi:membrane-bound lytic murein transglycosylase C
LVFILVVFILGGCSTRFAEKKEHTNSQSQTVVKKERIEYIPFREPDIVVYEDKKEKQSYEKRVKKPTKAQIEYKRRVKYVQDKAAPHWGERARVADRYNYVKYQKDFKARTIIDFENAKVIVETTDTNNPIKTLKEVIVNTLLNTENPEDVDLFSTRHVTHVGIPFLHDRVVDFDSKAVRWKWRAERFAKQLLEKKLTKESIRTSSGSKLKYSVSFAMKQDLNSKSSNLHYASLVNKQAKRFDIDPALIFALIETESHFNPYATSAIPAYGLMQVVPSSAGRDAWKFLKKTKGKPTRNYLFNPHNNIEMGTAYMHILLNRYLSKVKDPLKRELCAIAAYNTGSGNVLRSFHKNRDVAFSKINALSSDALYRHLRKKLPYKETRDYIQKVTDAKKRYL